MLRFIILTLSAGVSKVVSVFQVSPTKTFYAFYVSLIVSDDGVCSWKGGGGDSAAAPDGRVQGAVKWTAKIVQIEIRFCGLNRF
jgi:hypothetical protein